MQDEQRTDKENQEPRPGVLIEPEDLERLPATEKQKQNYQELLKAYEALL